MNRRKSAEIRRGITIAKDVIAGRRVRPRDLVPFGFRDAPSMPLWQQAYNREWSRAARDGRIRPPK